MTAKYHIRELAQADLEAIWLYTYEEWGATGRLVPKCIAPSF